MTRRHCLPALTLILLAGCQTMQSSSLKSLSDSLAITKKEEPLKDSAYETPVRVIAIWSDAMYTQPGAPPTRGFGGRLYFYNAKDKPVPVEGQLVVYAFDETQQGEPVQTPSRKFGFTPEQFTEHYSPTELGASYSIWIPWDGIGGVRKSISLMPVFTASSGQVVMGEQSINILPGKAPAVEESPRQGYYDPTTPQATQGSGPAPQSQAGGEPRSDTWQQSHTYEPAADPQPRLRATTIALPMDMTRRLAQSTSTDAGHAGTSSGSAGAGDSTSKAGDNGAMASPPAEATAPATRFVRPRSPALRAPIARPSPVRAASSPRPEESQLAPPSPPSPPQDFSAAGSAPSDSEHASWVR